MDNENRSSPPAEANGPHAHGKFLRIDQLQEDLMKKLLEMDSIKRSMAVMESSITRIVDLDNQSIGFFNQILDETQRADQLKVQIDNELVGSNDISRNPMVRQETQLLQEKLSRLKGRIDKMVVEKKSLDDKTLSVKNELKAIVNKDGDKAILRRKIEDITLAQNNIKRLVHESKTTAQAKKNEAKATQKSSPVLAPQQESRRPAPTPLSVVAAPIEALAPIRYAHQTSDQNRADRNDSSCLVTSTDSVCKIEPK